MADTIVEGDRGILNGDQRGPCGDQFADGCEAVATRRIAVEVDLSARINVASGGMFNGPRVNHAERAAHGV
jgi:hypothetical protein